MLKNTTVRVLVLFFVIVPHFVFARTTLEKNIAKLEDEKITELPIPVVSNLDVSHLKDTWGDARSAGRTHEGIDIVVPRWTIVVSPTDAVISRIETTGNGGLTIWTSNPGTERFYFAHLEAVFPEIKVGDYVQRGQAIAFVGNSGNAQGTDPHLHFGIYSNDWIAENPYPRITETFSENEQVSALLDFLDYLKKLLKEKAKN